MIYDCLMLDSELDLLELRMKILKDVVDKFIVIESTESFTGRPKKAHLSENLGRFLELGNIESYVIDLPKGATPLERECYSRNYVQNLLNLSNTDITFISDLDEIIPTHNLLDNLELKKVYFKMQTSYYHINNVVVEPKSHNEWVGSVRIVGKLNESPQHLRDTRWYGPFIHGGYHWSFLGSPHEISDKLHNTHHQEYNTPELNNIDKINNLIKDGKEILGRGFKFEYEPLDKFPKQILEYPQFIK